MFLFLSAKNHIIQSIVKWCYILRFWKSTKNKSIHTLYIYIHTYIGNIAFESVMRMHQPMKMLQIYSWFVDFQVEIRQTILSLNSFASLYSDTFVEVAKLIDISVQESGWYFCRCIVHFKDIKNILTLNTILELINYNKIHIVFLKHIFL